MTSLDIPSTLTTGTAVIERRRTRPIMAWALVGSLILAFQAYVLVRWVTGPYFESVDAGPTPVPDWMKVTIWTYIPLVWIAFLFCLYWYLWRPWRQGRGITVDGTLVLAWIAFYWLMDPMANYSGLYYSFNAYIPNMGSWTHEVPGWLSPGSPGAQAPEPFLFGAPLYVVFFVPLTVLANYLMRRANDRFPRLGNAGLVFGCFVTMAAVETFFELFWMRLGFFTYAGGIEELTLFHGHYYQLPIYETVLWALPLTAIACLRYYLDDRGRSFVERGAEKVRVGVKRMTGLRTLAVLGFVYMSTIVFYFVPLYWFNTHADPWPEDIQSRSYFTNYLCGDGTDIACPGPDIPNFRKDSIRIDPNGRLVVPPGAELPRLIPFDTK